MSGIDSKAAEELRAFIERIEALSEQKKDVSADIADVFGEAKSRGYDVATIKSVIKLRKLSPRQRRDTLDLLDTYGTAIGLFGDTPLGRAAASSRLEEMRATPERKSSDDEDDERLPSPDDAPGSVSDAEAAGATAAAAGQKVTANPFPPRDPRRAAWDEGWCRATGTDGMAIPAELQRKAPAPAPEQPGAPA